MFWWNLAATALHPMTFGAAEACDRLLVQGSSKTHGSLGARRPPPFALLPAIPRAAWDPLVPAYSRDISGGVHLARPQPLLVPSVVVLDLKARPDPQVPGPSSSQKANSTSHANCSTEVGHVVAKKQPNSITFCKPSPVQPVNAAHATQIHAFFPILACSECG